MIADINFKGLDNWTPLHFAADEGKVEVVKELLKSNEIDIDSKSTIGRTPLHLAAMEGHTEIVRILTEHNASENCIDED